MVTNDQRHSGGGRMSKINKRIFRPFFCYDKKCKILHSSYSKESFEKGFSFFCYGRLPKEHIFIEKEAEHKNSICHCYYTPLKGAIRYFMCEGDLWGEANALCAVMNKLIDVRCGCGAKTYKTIRHTCFKCNSKRSNQ